MISNDKELAIVKQQVEQIIASNNQSPQNHNEEPIDPSNDISLQKLQAKITEYEALVAHDPENPILLEIESAEQISDLPIKASIAFKITTQELAQICELKEEQLQYHQGCDGDSEYESNFFKVITILGIQLIDDLFFVATMSNELKQKVQLLRNRTNLVNDTPVAA